MNSMVRENEPLLKKTLPPEKSSPSKVSSLRDGLVSALVMVLFMAAYVGSIPLMGQYIHHILEKQYFNSTNVTDNDNVCDRNASDNHTKLLDEIQKETSQKILYYSFAASFPSLVVNLVLGSYSDFLGRKLLFLFPLFGNLGKNIVTAAIIQWNLDTNLFYLAYGLDGIGGSFCAFLLAIFSYTADITPPKNKRTLAITIMEGCLGVATSAASLSTGYLIKSVGYFYPSLISVILIVIGIFIVIVILRETVVKTTKRDWSPFSNLKNVFGFFLFEGTRRRRLQFTLGLLIFFVGLITLLGRATIETLYQLDLPFCWSPVKIGYFGALRTMISVACGLIALKILQCCLRDEVIAIITMIDLGGSFVLEALASNDWMMYSVPAVGLIGTLAIPIMRSLMSRMAAPSKQGALFSALATVETVCNLFSNTLYNTVYEATVDTMKGAVFLMMAGFSVMCIILLFSFMAISKGRTIVYQVEAPSNNSVSVQKQRE